MRWRCLLAVAAGLSLGPASMPARQVGPPADLAALKARFEHDPSDHRAAIEYASAALRANQPDVARRLLYELLARPAQLPAAIAAEAWFQMGHVHFRAGEPDEAMACWRRVLRDHPASERASGAAVNLASLIFEVSDDAAGARALLTSRLRDGTIRGGHIELANFLLFQVDVALRRYADARARLSTLPTAGDRYALVQDVVPVVLWKTGDEARARDMLDARFAAAADNASALNNLATTLTAHGVAPDFAVACAARAIVVSAGSRHDIWDTYAEALFRTGQIDKAIEAEEKAAGLATAQRDQAAYRARIVVWRAVPRIGK
jgi:hypothetical protein